jgi:ubiquitin carboxyl-terminal hydrolase 25
MITTPRASVRPEQELARLTLISSINEAEIRRRSTISGIRPFGLGEINGLPVAGPLGPPQTVEPDKPENTAGQKATSSEESLSKDALPGDIDSEATLVSETSQSSIHQSSSGDKENIEVPQPATLKNTENVSGAIFEKEPVQVGPPNRPPPNPPRPAESERKRQLIDEVELGAQQDVTEVINNVLFQSECAIKPRGIAPDGEQLDQIKE